MYLARSECQRAGGAYGQNESRGGSVSNNVTAGRDAIQRHDWDAALTALSESDRESGLSPDDLVLLGDAYWWTGQTDNSVEALERAYSGFVNDDRISEAASIGALLSYFAIRRQAFSVARGWMTRVGHLLEGRPPSIGHAWLKMMQVGSALFHEADLPAALELADEAIRLAGELGVPDVQSLAMSFKGIALVQLGRWREGVALVDEATVIAMSEGGDLRATSDVYCNTIATCSLLGDYRRAGEWTDAAERWMAANAVGGYTGICQVHRAELKRHNGSWGEAEQVARRACVELERFRLLEGVGFAHNEIGEIRRRMGDLDAAEQAFARAHEYGWSSQPGISLLEMNRGDVESAAKSISSALARRAGREEGSASSLSRARLLPAQIEIALAVDDTATAHRALTELEEVADNYEGVVWRANALMGRGWLALHEGRPADAIESLTQSSRIWRDGDMPYEAARARALLGAAHREQGDDVSAQLELKAARATFERLGARLDLRRVEEIAGDILPKSREQVGEKVTKVFMFTDIVTSTDLIGIIGDDAWEELLKWHDRTLRELFTRHGGVEVNHTGDGFFVAFDDSRSAVESAVSIQRKLDSHRHEHGFAPRIRIGMHLTEATRQMDDYSGGGVHVAARIGGVAGPEEILISADVVEGAGVLPYQMSSRRVELKGITDEVEVHAVDWR